MTNKNMECTLSSKPWVQEERFIEGEEETLNEMSNSGVKIQYTIYKELDGARRKGVSKVGDGGIICRFEKTPLPKNPGDVVCPHFMELKWGNGCYFDCAWCYLNGTYRFHPEWKNGKPNIKDFDLIKLQVEAFLNNGSRPEILNAGELSDSLICETKEKSFSKFIIPIFNAQSKHKILFLTKSINVQNILDLKMPNQVILSWTLNAAPVAQRWEKKAPRVEQRIKAAKKCYDQGYEVRVRIDPMVPIRNWEMHYKELIDTIFSEFVPERITIGSLRGLSSTINTAKDKTWIQYMTEHSNWGRKIPLEQRIEMYSTIMGYLREEYDFDRIALCKETLETWEKLRIDYREMRCNCLL